MINSDVVIVIPALNPDEKFLAFLKDLAINEYNQIIVIDDGSEEASRNYFSEASQKFGCTILHHSINLGQGRAYKTAFNYYLMNSNTGGYYEATIGLIQCDCDGQHCVDDINRCVELLRSNPEKFILGIRNFEDKAIPFRSRFGNNCTSFVFKWFCGLDLKDTQTGLKGIPKSFIPKLMETPGEHFEYASSVLLETKRYGIQIIQFPIKTIYINGNKKSHFKPLMDSIRIYSLILKYLASSVSSFVVDIAIYSIFISVLSHILPKYYVIISTYLAKIFSCTYVYLINKRIVFQSNENDFSAVWRFILLCVAQSTCSGILTSFLILMLKGNEVLCKIAVDILLFFISFQIQNRWVFSKKSNKVEI